MSFNLTHTLFYSSTAARHVFLGYMPQATVAITCGVAMSYGFTSLFRVTVNLEAWVLWADISIHEILPNVEQRIKNKKNTNKASKDELNSTQHYILSKFSKTNDRKYDIKDMFCRWVSTKPPNHLLRVNYPLLVSHETEYLLQQMMIYTSVCFHYHFVSYRPLLHYLNMNNTSAESNRILSGCLRQYELKPRYVGFTMTTSQISSKAEYQ